MGNKDIKKMDNVLGPPPRPPKSTIAPVYRVSKNKSGSASINASIILEHTKKAQEALEGARLQKLQKGQKMQSMPALKQKQKVYTKKSVFSELMQKDISLVSKAVSELKKLPSSTILKKAPEAKQELMKIGGAEAAKQPIKAGYYEQGIKDMMKELQNRRKLLSQQEDAILSKQVHLEKLENELRERSVKYGNEKRIEASIRMLENRKKDIATELLNKEIDLKRLVKDISEKDKKLEMIERRNREKGAFIENLARKFTAEKVALNKEKERLEKEKADILKEKEDVEQRRKKLNEYENEVLNKEKTLESTDISIRADILALREQREKLAEEVAVMLGEKHAIDSQLAEMARRLKETELIRKQKIEGLEIQKSNVMREKEKNCDEQHRLLEIAGRLREREDMVSQKEIVLNEELSRLGKENIDLKKEIEKAGGKVDNEINAKLKEKEKKLEEEYRARIQALDREYEQLKNEKKRLFDDKKLAEAEAVGFAEGKRKDLEESYNHRENELRKKELELREKEAALLEDRKKFDDYVKKEKDMFHSNFADYEVKKRELEQQIREKQEYLGDLQAAESMLANKENEIIEKVKKLEYEEALLKHEEDVLVKKISESKGDRKLLEEKEKELLGIVNALDKKEASLRLLEQQINIKQKNVFSMKNEFEKKLARIKKISELKEDIPSLKNNLNRLMCQEGSLKKEIEKLAGKKYSLVNIDALKNEIKGLEAAKSSVLSSKEKLVKELEQERDVLEQEINKLVAKAADLEKMKEIDEGIKTKFEIMDIKEEQLEKGFKELEDEEKALSAGLVTAKDIQSKSALRSKILKTDSKDELKIYTLLEQAKDAVMNRRFEEARGIYSAIQQEYRKISVPQEEKRKLYFDVVELKADIELKAM